MRGHSVKRNQDSPLLCLPPEIRNRIWEYTLGGNDIRQVDYGHRISVFLAKPHEGLNTFALLRVCRQTYAETALLPFSVNTFAALDCCNLGKSVKAFKKYQRSQITHLQVEHLVSDVQASQWFKSSLDLKNYDVLPGLRCVKFQLFPCMISGHKSFSEAETILRSLPEFALLADKYDAVVEEMEVSWLTFCSK
jgi:hypothetical protein